MKKKSLVETEYITWAELLVSIAYGVLTGWVWYHSAEFGQAVMIGGLSVALFLTNFRVLRALSKKK